VPVLRKLSGGHIPLRFTILYRDKDPPRSKETILELILTKMILFVQVLLVIELAFISPVSLRSSWLSLALMSSANNYITCDEIGNRLNHRQVEVCKKNNIVMNSVKYGASMAVSECQHQFRHRRWNCTTVHFERSPVFGNSANLGTREAAFVHALSSAGVAFAVTRSCSDGRLGDKCGCDQKYNGKSNRGWEWAGCSEDVNFGVTFSKEFVDAREHGRKADPPIVKMNLHNNHAGRLAVKKHMRIQCKCHGMTGSCKVKTCWRSLPDFRRVGDHLKEKFDGATMVQLGVIGSNPVLVPRNDRFKPHTIDDLVYLDNSPDFCDADPNTGSLGTQGRFCNRTSEAMDGCNLMCCNRGYSTRREIRVEQCFCKFHWCCLVRCQKCRRMVEVSVCK